jgi:hypothetical protein
MGDEVVRGIAFPFESVYIGLRANEVIQNP